MRHLVAHPNQGVNLMHHLLVQVRPARAAGTIAAAMTQNTTVLLVNAVTRMTNQTCGPALLVFQERADGTPTTLTFLKNANGQLRKYA